MIKSQIDVFLARQNILDQTAGRLSKRLNMEASTPKWLKAEISQPWEILWSIHRQQEHMNGDWEWSFTFWPNQRSYGKIWPSPLANVSRAAGCKPALWPVWHQLFRCQTEIQRFQRASRNSCDWQAAETATISKITCCPQCALWKRISWKEQYSNATTYTTANQQGLSLDVQFFVWASFGSVGSRKICQDLA